MALVNFRSGLSTTAQDLAARVEDIAQSLQKHLPPDKSVVAVSMPNGEEYVATVLALWILDHVVMPLPTTLSEAEIEKTVRNGPAIALLRSGLALSYRQKKFPEFSLDGLAFVRFTSGTTENARGVLIAHDAILARAESFARALDLSEGKSVLWHLDMSYHFTTSIAAFLLKGCILHLGSVLLPARFAEWMTAQSVDYFFSLPFFYDQLAQHEVPVQFRGDTRLYVTGQTIDPGTLKVCRALYNRPIHRMYGIIEIGIPVLGGDSDDPKVLGELVSPYEMKIDANEAISFRGPGNFRGYLVGEKFKHQPYTDPWFNTGDLGEFENGALKLKGRAKEILISSAHKFFPSEVENVLRRVAGIEDAVVFLKEGRLIAMYEGPAALDPAHLTRFLREHVEHAKVPERFVHVPRIPRTMSGKIVRNSAQLAASLDGFA